MYYFYEEIFFPSTIFSLIQIENFASSRPITYIYSSYLSVIHSTFLKKYEKFDDLNRNLKLCDHHYKILVDIETEDKNPFPMTF